MSEPGVLPGRPGTRRRTVVGALVLATLGPALGVFALRAWVVEPYRVPSVSMAPTVLVGDHVLARKAWTMAPLERGTIVVFRYPNDRRVTFIKRVIGLAGDEIAFDDNWPQLTGRPTQHGDPTQETWIDADCAPSPVSLQTETIDRRTWTIARGPRPGMLAKAQKVVVPPDHVYVVGDNRDHSMDSRQWGFVPVADVIGTVDRVWWSMDPCTGAARTERIGPVR